MLALIKAGEIVQLVAENSGFAIGDDWTMPAYDGWQNAVGYELVAIADAAPTPGGKQVVSTSVEMVNGTPTYVHDLEDAPPPPREMVLKSVVQARIIDAGKMGQAYAALTSNPVYFARWFAPDHPSVYCDDPDAVGLVSALGLDPAIILAVSP